MVSYHPPKHFEKKIPAGDDRLRLVCNQCEWVHYENPKVIVGLVPILEDKILLCNRAIEPRQGYWTIPAGFLELKETAEAGAQREAWEEARVKVEINALLGVYSIPRAGQVHLIYRAIMDKPEFAAGPESHDVRLFAWEEIPWDNLAFLSNHWALNHYYESREWDTFAPFSVPAEDIEEVSGR